MRADPAVTGAAVPRGPARRQQSRTARCLTLLWALLPLAFALPAAPCFAWAAWRLRSRALAVEATGYLAVSVLWVTLANQRGPASGAGAVVAVAAAVIACARAFVVRRRLLGEPPAAAPQTSGLAAAATAADAGWTPTFPAQTLPPQDPSNPATWVSAVACNGRDRHTLSMPLGQATAYGVGGAALVALDAYLHVYGRGLGVGIGLMLAPVFAALFARWVDGPVLYYRSWGHLHRLPLASVTAVTVGKPTAGTTAVALSAPGLPKPFRLSLRSRGYVMSPAARDHLRGWLSAPHVPWSPEAAALFDEHTRPRTAATRRRHRLLATGLTVVLPLGVAAAGGWLVYQRNAARAIPGAAGYRTFSGPHGKVLAVGRPWGRRCQPIRIAVERTVPDWVYAQVSAVVAEARRDGIDVTLESRAFTWFPTSLYYPAGQSVATVARVGVFATDRTPPRLAGGHLENIELGWDAAVDPDGRHEDLTHADGDLQMQVLAGHPQAVRRSVRQLVALTQGILRTSRTDSGIARNTSLDAFSPADIAAMRLMSGCGNTAAPTTSPIG